MVFEGLASKLQDVVRKFKGKGRVTEADIKEVMREIKLALLEADVNFKVVKDFISAVSQKAVGQDVLESLTPGQQIIKIIHDELVNLLGGTQSKIAFSPRPPTVIMLVGLQGSGKTTTCGKLGNALRKQGKNPLLAACDVYRPAAVKQLEVVGEQLSIAVYSEPGSTKTLEIADKALKQAEKHGNDVVIIDTAGRLHIDEQMMNELVNLKSTVRPYEIMLVVDSMTGQDAVNVAETFNEKLGVDGIILTKLDGDTRGGAALSVKSVTGKPIKFVGMGEKLNELEPFYPERMASRILGMGDVMSLIEKAQEAFDEKKALEMEKKLRTQQFTLEDFLGQMQQMKSLGSINQVLSMMPGLSPKQLQGVNIDEKQMVHFEAIIQSMTRKERTDPAIINASRKKRIAAGSGTSIQDVNSLLKRFDEVKLMMKQMMGMQKSKKGMMKLPFFK